VQITFRKCQQLCFQGQDSVGASLAFTLHLLATHEEHQMKCISEIDEIFGNDDRAPTLADLNGMKYLEMCIKESLRFVYVN